IQVSDPNAGRKAILGVVSERNLNLVNLSQSKKNLEELFREITR
ncbi:MAG TPA: gliding motility-associated ABC transporter ATP-binding subunit GldA, partial [Algoriphagus sp.]|nr:gliding motility-associated ABC transporter ATP-binding subunit GldA [Algoriphagus sp.]